MKILFAIIAIIGYIYNIKGYRMISYIIWLISNSLWALYSFYNGELELSLMFMSYNVFILIGIYNGRKNILQLSKKGR